MTTNTPLNRKFNIITRQQAQQFVDQGWVLVEQLFSREVAEGVAAMLWDELDEDPNDRTTWTRDNFMIAKSLKGGAADGVVTERYQQAVEDLVGVGRTKQFGGVGYSPIRFPVKADVWQGSGFHVDGIWFHHHVNSPEQGIVGVDLMSDIDKHGGGTAIRVGSHRIAARILAEAEPQGMTCQEIGVAARDATADLPVIEAIGRAGDALFMHPHTVHGSSTNLTSRVRLACNRCVSLTAPMRFDRADGDYSLVEWAVRDAINNVATAQA